MLIYFLFFSRPVSFFFNYLGGVSSRTYLLVCRARLSSGKILAINRRVNRHPRKVIYGGFADNYRSYRGHAELRRNCRPTACVSDWQLACVYVSRHCRQIRLSKGRGDFFFPDSGNPPFLTRIFHAGTPTPEKNETIDYHTAILTMLRGELTSSAKIYRRFLIVRARDRVGVFGSRQPIFLSSLERRLIIIAHLYEMNRC